MSGSDAFGYALQALWARPARTVLIALATAIGVTAVLLLSALGEGARGYVLGQFEALGTDLLVVLPGRNETVGAAPPVFGETARELTAADARAIGRLPAVRDVAPIVVGAAPISVASGIERETTIIGTSEAMIRIRRLSLATGRFLPALEPGRSRAVCVLGFRVRRELFEHRNPLGQWVRIGDRRFRVIGVLAESGVSLGVNFDDLALVPLVSAQTVFNRESLFRILIEADREVGLERLADRVHRLIRLRHEGEDDITVITQDSVISTLGRIMDALTAALAGIAGVSLVVAGILIMNVMIIAVAERRQEVGILKALGARSADVLRIFLLEAAMLAGGGAAAGLLLAMLGSFVADRLVSLLVFRIPLWALLGATLTAVSVGLVFGLIPARRAARLDPVRALSRH